ncbi:MAG: M15 family metallopeptidase [Deltaproteobacteria bacterium]|nr:M15 family metallopeptidase [Deltaproteobacteria bacterium]
MRFKGRLALRLAAVLVLGILAACRAPGEAPPPVPPPTPTPQVVAARPADFVDAQVLIPGLVLDIRYYTDHNFVGARVDGYLAPRCLLTRPAAEALARVQNRLREYGYGLKAYDCYRPQRAVDHFGRWALAVSDTKTKAEFYPTVAKENLHSGGYIARHSGHSRGSTVDLTIVPLPAPPQPAYHLGQPQVDCVRPVGERFADNTIDMGTGFDCFSPLAATANPAVDPDARRNRLLLKTLMESEGFKNYSQEWWHYTLRDEPYPHTYFDFPVE